MCEHRWAGKGEIKIMHENERLSMIFCGKPAEEVRSSGVALLMNAEARKALMEWHGVSDRIMTARFRTRARPVTVVQAYAPTNEAEENVKDGFYSQLVSTINSIQKGDILIAMGDYNAKCGADNKDRELFMGKFGTGTMNDNGERFLDFCAEADLVVGGTLFKHQQSHLNTWYSNDGVTRNQIDHIAISRKWRNSLQDVRVYRSFDVYSDHKMLMGTIKISLAAIKKKSIPLRRKIDPRNLQHPQIMNSFKAEVHNSLADIQPSDPQEHWASIRSSLQTAGEKLLPRVLERKKCYISDATWALIEQRKRYNDLMNAAQSHADYKRHATNYHEAEKKVKKSARFDRRQWFDSLANLAEEAARNNQSRDLYRLTRQIAGRSSYVEKPVKDGSGRDVTDENLQLEQWTEHFRTVLTVPSSIPSNSTQEEFFKVSVPTPIEAINSECPNLDEVRSAIKNLKSGKAPGPDGIYIELFKADVELTASHLHPIIESLWQVGEIPQEMKEALLIKLPKKGDLGLTKNWRGIALQNSINKLIAKIILDRISPSIEPLLRREQAGFRRGRSCVDQINTLRIIVEQCREHNTSLCLLFIDFERAFDSLNQHIMWQILAKYGIPDKLVEVIRELYDDSNLKVVHRGLIGAGFQVTSGVKQGCLLSPIIFIIILDYVMRHAIKKRGIQWSPFSKLIDLDYADDIVAMTHSLAEMQEFIDDLVESAAIVGLKINVGKTNLMRVNAPVRQTRATTQSIQQLKINDEVIKEVNEFVYLGSVISTGGGDEEDVRRRINLANVAFGSLAHIWRSHQLSLRLKLKIFRSNVVSVLLYGSETWRNVQSLICRLQVFVNKCLRKICGIFYPNVISNVELHTKTNQQPLGEIILRRKWRWIGHTLRKSPDDLCRQALDWTAPGKRGRGRPKITWQVSATNEAKQQGKSWKELAALAKNREEFDRFVNALRFDNGAPSTA